MLLFYKRYHKLVRTIFWLFTILAFWLVLSTLIYSSKEFNDIQIYRFNGEESLKSEILNRLKKHDVIIKDKVFVVFAKSGAEYNLFTLYLYKGSLALNYNILNVIIVNPNYPENRQPINVLTHELGHSFLKQELGIIPMSLLPTWKEEGFCEYISESSSMPYEVGLAIFKSKEKEKEFLASNSQLLNRYRYFTYRLVYTYLIEQKGMTWKEIFDENLDFEILKNEIRSEMINDYFASS